MRIMRYAVVFVLFMVSIIKADSEGYKKWLACRESLMQDSSVVRYYTFEDVKDSKSIVKDLKGSGNDLVFKPFIEGAKAVDDLKVVEGRFAEKSAVRLDRGWYQGPSLDIANKQFTFTCWFRRQGPGSIVSSSSAEEGAIVSVAGWDRGWCIATACDKYNTLRFCLGQPGGCEGVMSDISIPANAWHHLAVTWNGKEMLIYFNGILVGKREYAGSYNPSRKEDFLRLGYAGGVTGSVVLDIDEAAIYNRALSGKEIRGLGRASLSPANDIFAVADKYIKAGDYKSARKEYEKLKGMKSLEYGRELALFNIAESYRLEKDYADAHKTYREIFSLPGLTAYYRIYGMFQEAEVYIEQGNYNSARKLYADITKTEGALTHHIFKAELYTGDTYRKERKYTQARSIYEHLLKEQDTSAFPHEGYRLELTDRLEALEGLADRQAEKSIQKKRAEWVNSPKHGIYVSPDGNDSNQGTKEKPFATIKRAQEAVRRIKESGMPKGGIAVYLRGGRYFITESLTFGKEDSGTADSPVVYRSYPGEEARIIGGKQITNFEPLADPEILSRLPEESRGKVWVSDLKAAGITDYGEFRNRGTHTSDTMSGAMELFFNTKPMQLARWPNKGWEKVFALVDPEDSRTIAGRTYQNGRFRYSGDRPERWTKEKDIWTAGFFMWEWDYVHTKVVDIDTKNHIVNLAPNIRWNEGYILYGMPVRKDTPYHFYNILSELDVPEEFYIDRDTGKLYFYPPGELEGSEIIVSSLDAPVIELKDVSNMVLYRLTVEDTWRNAIEIKGGRNNLVAGSVIRNTGVMAVMINGGWNHGVAGCDIYDTGAGGLALIGGDREKLVPGGHYAENNHIYRFNRFSHGGGKRGIYIYGTGNRAAHNLMHDSPFMAIYFHGVNNIIEYNEIYDAVHEMRDAGAIYTEGPFLVNRGNLVRYNFVHHISHQYSSVPEHVLFTIYQDGLCGGVTITGNVLYHCAGVGVEQHAPDSRVENNIFVDNRLSILSIGRSVLMDPFSRKQWEDYTLFPLKYRQPPWASRFPLLRDILKHEHVSWPKNVVIERNISIGGEFLQEHELFQTAKEVYESYVLRNNIDGYDPLFVNPDNRDFRIRAGSPVYGITGSEPVPFAEIGLYEDALRASWPVERSVAGKYWKAEKEERLSASLVRLAPPPFTGKPVIYEVKRRVAPIKLDGRLEKEEWAGLDKSKAMIIEKIVNDASEDKLGDRSYAWMVYDNEYLYIAVENTPNPFKPDMNAREKKLELVLNEISIEGIHDESTWWWQRMIDTGPVYIFWGHSNGRFEVKNIFRMPRQIVEHLNKSIEYKTVMLNEEDYHWTAEWKIPLAALNIYQIPDSLRFNMGAPKRGGWFAWVATGWQVDRAGILKFIK